VQRQLGQWLETGSLGRKSTYGWDEATQSTFHQRDKEEAHDYRYFPDPDLMPVEVSDERLTRLKAQVGELPQARRRRYVEALGLGEKDAAILAADRETGDFYEAALKAGGDPKRVGNLVVNVLGTLANRRGMPVHRLGIAPGRVSEVAALMDQNRIAASSALPLCERLLAGDAPAGRVAQELGLVQVSDASAIDAAIDALVAQNPRPLQDYRGGKQAAMGALVGMVMKAGKGLNPKLVQERLRERLGQ
jgi:aspartyl-tRNA(Asn)/glutamyl-tRNA(Gln) amidotransferase subunit B